MAINFPSSPTTGQVYEYQSTRWRWNGSAWDKYEVFTFNGLTANVGISAGAGITLNTIGSIISIGVINVTGPTGPTGPQGVTGVTGPVGDYVVSWNGLTGAVTFSNYVASFGGRTGTVGAGITTNQILYWANNDVAGSNNFIFDGTDVVTLAETGHLTGRLLGAVLVPIKNTSGVSIPKGTPVYATGSVGASGVVEVAACDAANSAKMPSIGLADSTLGINNQGHAVVFGVLKQVNTSAYNINGTVFVAAGGGLTGIKPTGANDLIQNIGRVVRVQASTGEILVSAIGRSNDVPNILEARSWLQMPDGMTATGLVRSLNGFTGDVTAIAGSGLGVTNSGKTITFTNTGVTGFNGLTGNVSGVTAVNAGSGISISGSTNPTITNIGVQSWNGLTGAVTGVTTSVANTFTALQTFNAGISAAGATFNGSISGTTGTVTFGQSAFTVPVTIRKTYLDNPEVGGQPGPNTENKIPLTISYTTDPTSFVAEDVLIGLYDATGATYSTRIKTAGIQTGTVTATSFTGTLYGSVNATNGNKITTAVFDTPETADGDPPPVFTFNAATDTDGDFDGYLDETTVLQMGFAGATFSTNVYAPNLVNSFNGDTGAVKLYIATVNEHESRGSGITAQSDNTIFTDFVGNNFSSSIAQAGWLGANANGGSFTISTVSTTSYGFDKCNGVINFITGTTNNATGYAACLLQASHIPGIPTPSTGFITKYEIECRFMTDSDVTSQDTKTRIGFADTWVNTAPGDGVYFERTYDALLPLTETTFQVVFRNGGAEERINTGVTFAASTIYRTYLCVERNTSGTLTTTWEILNDTTNVTSTGTAAPTTTARYPTASTDYINPGCIIQKTGSVTTATSRLIRVDYIGARIRRPLNRSMKLFA